MAAKETPADVAPKVKATPEQAMRKRIGRTIGRGVWKTGFKAENPQATTEETQKAWAEARKDFTKIGMQALKTIEKSGFQVVQKPAE